MAELLLAKSEPQISLKQHTEDGLEVWKCLQISFPLAPKIAEKDNFWWLLRLAIITHDLGKSHQEFQKIIKFSSRPNPLVEYFFTRCTIERVAMNHLSRPVIPTPRPGLRVSQIDFKSQFIPIHSTKFYIR